MSFRDAPVLVQKNPIPPTPPPPPQPWGPCRGPEHGSSGSISVAHLFTTYLILLQIQTRLTAPIGSQECDGGLQKKKPQVNTASVARLFDNKKGWRAASLFIVSLLFFPVPVSPPPHPAVSSCYPISIACAEWFSHVHTIITLHFQPSQSHKYLVYRLLMFIQSTGLHCLGTIARQGPFGRKKKSIPNEK